MIDYYLEKHNLLNQLIELHAIMIGFTRYEQYCINNGIKHYSKLRLNYEIKNLRERYSKYLEYY
jgi:hypothetical protein